MHESFFGGEHFFCFYLCTNILLKDPSYVKIHALWMNENSLDKTLPCSLKSFRGRLNTKPKQEGRENPFHCLATGTLHGYSSYASIIPGMMTAFP